MAPFRVIIVGGSIVGLTLANILEQYGIDYIVLEKHEKIAPSLGAGFAIWANGARVLDQLGCYDALEKVNAPVNQLMMFNENGEFRGLPPGLGEWTKTLFGYQMRFMERRHAVQALFDNLRDKSKVHTSSKIVKVESHSDGATVETSDGSVFYGDVVIGADGVHSRVCAEIQRCALKESPGADLFPEKDAFESTWSGLFGISNATLGMQQDQAFKNTQKGRSYLAARGPDDTIYWILFFKNEKKTQGSSIPRYTDEDRERLVAMYENDVVKSGYTFGDLYKSRIQSSIVPLEEGVLKTCFYKRVVLVGDSWHKVHPISGLGGNHGILSAAFLADELKALAELDEAPSEESLHNAFLRYQKARGPTVQMIVHLSHAMQRLDALDGWLITVSQKIFAPMFSMKMIQSSFAKMISPANRLKHLPHPSRRGQMGFMDEVKIQPKPRSLLANLMWISMFALVVLAFYPFRDTSNVTETIKWDSYFSSVLGLDAPTTMQLYFNLSISVVLSIVCVESYRGYFSLQLLSSALPFAIASFFIGWEYLIPIYFSLFVVSTAARPSYFPSARTLDLAMVKALFPAYPITYVVPTVFTIVSPESSAHVWRIAHAALPVVLWLCGKVASRVSVTFTGPETLYGNKDVEPLVKFFAGISVVQATAFGVNSSNALIHGLYWYGRPTTPTECSAIILDLVVLFFILFTYWDLRRVNALTIHYPELFNNLIIAFAVSPATALGMLWATRERHWEEARGRKIEKAI